MTNRTHLGETLDRDGVAIGARATVVSPTLVEVYGSIGLDFAWIDLEHTGPSGFDSRELERLARAGEVAGIDPLVRTHSGDPDLIRKVLDAGVRSVLVPRVETADDVREAVEASRFVYDGDPGARGASAARSARWGDPPGDYADREDESAAVGVMIESAAAVENVEEILAVPELGFVFVGPADLSTSLGHPLETGHPEVETAIETVREAATDADVPIGRIANDPRTAREAIDDGYRILRIGDEVSAARTVLGERVSAIRGD